MKKNFFKKLSFVLALAMIVSVIAPAAGAFAATAPKLNASTKYLTIAGTTAPSEFDFNVVNKDSAWKYKYTSSKPEVATVTAGTGVVKAVAVGTTTITCTVTNKSTGKLVKKVTATVKVKDAMTSIELTNVPTKALKVNDVNDFGRTFTTEAGKDKTSTLTRYAVDSDKATIDPITGVFTATEAGKYTVKVMGFQTVAKYNAWVAAKDFASTTGVVVSKTAEVVVDPSIVDVKQTTLNKFEVTFDSDMSKTDVTTKGLLYQVINGKNVLTGTEKIKSIKLDDATHKIATVEMYANFNQGKDYNFVYGTLTDTFTAATVDLKYVDSIEFSDFDVDPTSGTGVNMNTKVVAKNADGVVIYTSADTAFTSVLSYTYPSNGDFTKGFTSGNMAYIYTEGYSVVIKATFKTYVYNATTQKYEEIVKEDSATATGKKPNTDVNTATLQYIMTADTVRPANDKDWSKTTFTMAAGDPASTIHSRFKTNNDNDNWKSTEPFTFKSTDTDKLLITGRTLVPLKAGNDITVLVYKGSDVVGSFQVNIVAARALAGLSEYTAFVKVGNNADAGVRETATVSVKAIDTMNDVMTNVSVSAPVVTNWPGNSTKTAVSVSVAPVVTSGDNKGEIKYSATAAANAVPGAYQVKSTISLNGVNKDVYFTVQVEQSNTAETNTAVTYQIVLNKTSVDVKAAAATNEVTVDVYGINAAGMRVSRLTNDQFDVVLKLNGSEVTTSGVVNNVDTATTTGTSIFVVRNDATVLKALATGNYSITAKLEAQVGNRAAGSEIAYAQLAVSDTTNKEVIITTTAVSAASNAHLDDAVKAAFEIKLNGNNCEAQITGYKVSDGTAAAATVSSATAATQAVTVGSLYVESVEVTVTNASSSTTTVYTFSVDKTIAITQ